MNDLDRMRLVVFGSSIVSDWQNPIATSARPILSELTRMGHDVLFLEERNNPWLVGLLKARGMAPIRAFDAVYPEIQHRTYDLPRGIQRTVTFAQHVGTADAILALPGTPKPVLEEINAFRSPSVVRAVHADAGSCDAEITLRSFGKTDCDAVFGPAVATRASSSRGRTAVALVAYDTTIGILARESLSELNSMLLDQTRETIAGWNYAPEVNLPNWYEERQTVVVASDWRDRLSWARLLLPMASGCRVIAIGPGATTVSIPGLAAVDDVSQLSATVCEFFHDDTVSQIAEEFDASRHADNIIGVLRRIHDEKRRARR